MLNVLVINFIIMISLSKVVKGFKLFYTRPGSRDFSMMARKKREFPQNPVVVVTGASRGIGKAISLKLAEYGCKIVVNYASSEGPAEEVCEQIKEIGGDLGAEGFPMKANMASRDEVIALFDNVVDQIGPVNILVNNAGITRDMLTMMMTKEDYADVIDLNLNGVFWASQAAFKSSMMGAKMGRIINIASIVGQVGNVGQANYAAAKGGVIGMTRALAKEFGTRNICVNAVCPGFIESDMTADLDLTDIVQKIPLKRLGTTEEVGELVSFLALSKAGAYMSGHCYDIDGGLAIGAT